MIHCSKKNTGLAKDGTNVAYWPVLRYCVYTKRIIVSRKVSCLQFASRPLYPKDKSRVCYNAAASLSFSRHSNIKNK